MLPGLSWIQIAGGAAAAFALSFLLNTVEVDHIEAKQRQALADQKTQLEQKCKDDQAITKGANDELQKKYNSIAGKLAASKRLQPAHCIIVASSGETISAGSGVGHAGQNGISTDWLYEYAAECETYRTQRISLEKFIDDTWAAAQQ